MSRRIQEDHKEFRKVVTGKLNNEMLASLFNSSKIVTFKSK